MEKKSIRNVKWREENKQKQYVKQTLVVISSVDSTQNEASAKKFFGPWNDITIIFQLNKWIKN